MDEIYDKGRPPVRPHYGWEYIITDLREMVFKGVDRFMEPGMQSSGKQVP
jgi:hypothetical protein